MKIRITIITALFAASILAVAAYPTLRTHPVLDPLWPASGAEGYAAVEAVFVLDTTGSMAGMIETARETIWSIATTLAQGDPRPEISIGLVAFRDRGDEYVTRVIDLTTDLDALYAELMQFRAAGGGDTPEAVNEALYDAIHEISWSPNPQSYKVVFLVGDAPPHMNYPDDVKYPQTLAVANAKGIIVNTIQCGDMASTTHHWQRIAALGQGRYFAVEQAGGAVAIDTPYDDQLAQAVQEIERTRYYYGTEQERAAQAADAAGIEEIVVAGTRIMRARRATFVGASGLDAASAHRDRELVAATSDGSVDVAEIDADLLPPTLRELSIDERRELIAQAAAQREALQQQIRDLSAQRQEFITARLAELGGADESLNVQIFETVRMQAAERGITYEGVPAW